MEDTGTPELVFPFVCSNHSCNASYDIKGFANVYMLWGYIFMTCGEKCIIGLTCPECKQTTIKKYSAIPLDFSVAMIDNFCKGGTHLPLNQILFVYFTKFSPYLIPGNQIIANTEDASQADNYRIPSDFVPIRHNPNLERIPSYINSNDIGERLKLENEQNLKVFTRIVPFSSVYYLSDVWLKNLNGGSLSPEFLEECHTSLEILYVNGYKHRNEISAGLSQKSYMKMITSDLTPDEFQNMDRSLYAWNTEIFKKNIIEFLNTYKALRNRKDFELVCYNDLINRYARIFYYNPTIVAKQKLEEELYQEETAHFVEPEPEEKHEFDENGNAIFNDFNPNMSSNLQGPQAEFKTPESKTLTGYHDNIIEKLNKIHAVVDYGGQILIMNEKFDPSLERQYQSFSKKTDFFDKYANQTLKDPCNPKQTISEAQYWWKHEKRRSYEGIVFSPGKHYPGFYNLWQGFPVKPVQGNWSLFRDHIFRIISNKNNEIFRWIMSWMARIVQDPGGERPGTSIVLRGGQGTGKTFFARMFGSLFGRHYLSLSHSTHLTGQFNHHLKDALVVLLDEGFLVGDKQSEGLLKSMVTESIINIEQKFKDLITVKNHINLIIASNNEKIVPAGLDERRFFVTDISEEQKQNKAYFAAVEQQMNNGGREAMLYELMSWDYSDVSLRTIPKTKALFEQKHYSMSTVQKFWYEKLLDGRLSKTHQNWEGWISFQELYDSYLEFARLRNDKNLHAQNTFGKELRKVCKSMSKGRPNENGGRNHIKKFPALDICRKEFEKFVDVENLIEWEDPAETIQIGVRAFMM